MYVCVCVFVCLSRCQVGEGGKEGEWEGGREIEEKGRKQEVGGGREEGGASGKESESRISPISIVFLNSQIDLHMETCEYKSKRHVDIYTGQKGHSYN